jgi:DNA-binding transcriptional LysR family regulator
VDWNDARVLLALLRAKNLDDASTRLGVDPSTVSRRLSSLEKETGTRLFVRTRDGLSPTETARRLLSAAEAMEEAAADLSRSLHAGESVPKGRVRVATTEGFARMLVEEGLLTVCDDRPALELELMASNKPVDLAHGEADIAVRLAALRQSTLKARCIATMPIALFASPRYVLARGHARTIAGLHGHDVLLPTGDLARLPESELLASRPRVNVAFRSNSMPALIAAASKGRGIVPLPLAWGDSDPSLVRLFVLDKLPKRRVWLVMHEAARDRPAVRIVADHIAAIFARVFPR